MSIMSIISMLAQSKHSSSCGGARKSAAFGPSQRESPHNLSSCHYTVSKNALNMRRFKNCKWPERAGSFPGSFRRSLLTKLTAVAIDAAAVTTEAKAVEAGFERIVPLTSFGGRAVFEMTPLSQTCINVENAEVNQNSFASGAPAVLPAAVTRKRSKGAAWIHLRITRSGSANSWAPSSLSCWATASTPA